MEYFDWLEQEADEQRREQRGERIQRFLPPRFLTESHRMVMQVVKTWNPPFRDDPANRCLETCVKTGFMGGLAVAMGEDFPWHELNVTQERVIRQFLRRTRTFLTTPEAPCETH